MPMPIVSVEIGCRDKEKTAAFYGEVFGWTFSPYGTHATQFDTGSEAGIQGHITALGHEPHDYIHFYVETADIAGTIEKVKAAGGEAFLGPYPMDDGRLFAWVKDPDGKSVALITPKP